MTSTLAQSETWLRERMAKSMHERSKNAEGAMRALIEQSRAMEDRLVPKAGLYFVIDQGDQLLMEDRTWSEDDIDGMGGYRSLHENAIQQLSSKLGIPTKFATDLSKGALWQRSLLKDMFNEHVLHTEKANFLVRSVNGQARAILSDRYRRMDNMPVFRSFLDATVQQGARLFDGHLSELSMYLEVMHPDIMRIQTPKNGEVAMAMGAQISSSDFGRGSLEVRTFMLQVVCGNGLTLKPLVRQVHLGRRLLQEDMAFSQHTMNLDTQTMASAVSDMVSSAFTLGNRESAIQRVLRASAKEVDAELVAPQLVDSGIKKEEVDAIMESLMRSSPEDGVAGEITTWKVTQAMTAAARNFEPERSREVSRIAGAMLN